jgi:peptidoglycan/LPS O-acetylase OafA/YrhL
VTITLAKPERTAARQRLQAWWPLSSGPREIQALDGLRALAALSVLFYHAFSSVTDRVVIFGQDVSFAWYYGQTGVHLFFVLSGFLLFLPYARAMLQARPLPSARLFYRRRALRILPAYWVCLAGLILTQLPLRWAQYTSLTGLENIAAHVVLFHDDFDAFNRTIEDPFWTLAVEWQFYLVLPLLAAGIAWLVGKTRSLHRLVVGVLGVIALALLLREVDAAIQARFPLLHGNTLLVAQIFTHITLGAQGKFLEVFGIGMLCSVLYVAGTEMGAFPQVVTRRVGIGLVVAALAVMFVLAKASMTLAIIGVLPDFMLVHPRNLLEICGAMLVGMGYGALVLGVLWGGRAVRAPFEWAAIRFVGLVSYSLYLWHGPIIVGAHPLISALPGPVQLLGALAVGFVIALPFAYASYQWVERPFLRRRYQTAPSIVPRVAT